MSYSSQQVEPKSQDLFTAINYNYDPFIKDFNIAKDIAINNKKAFFRPSSDGNSLVLVKENGEQIKYNLCYVNPVSSHITIVTKDNIKEYIPEYL